MARYALTLVNDELQAPLKAVIEFALTHGLEGLEMRSLKGRNVLALSREEQLDAARLIRASGLSVSGLASPLLKWPAPGRTARALGDQFGFDLAGRSLADVAARAAEAAHTFATRNVRIFTFLAHDGFAVADLRPALDELLAWAEREDLVLHIENEPVCNVRSVGELLALMRAYHHPRLKALLDIANAYAAGEPPQSREIAALMPFVEIIHFKDYDPLRRRFVALGDGAIPYPDFLATCLAAAPQPALELSIETHVPEDQPSATKRSLQHLRSLLGCP